MTFGQSVACISAARNGLVLLLLVLAAAMGCGGPSLDSTDPFERMKAVRMISDQNVLARVALEDKDGSVRVEAAKRLTSQETIAKVALEDRSAFTRSAVIELITDQRVLAKIAMEDRSRLVFEAAVKRLEDQDALSEVALKHSDEAMRMVATRHLTNQAVLAKIALNDKCPGVRARAIERLTNQEVLKNIVKDTSNLAQSKTAAQPWATRILESALGTSNLALSKTAAQQLTDQAILEEVAVGDLHQHVRCIAVSKLDNPGMLLDLAEKGERHIGEIAKVRLAFLQEEVASRVQASVEVEIMEICESYSYWGGGGEVTVWGEDLSVDVLDGEAKIAGTRTSTCFPQTLKAYELDHKPAEPMDVMSLLEKSLEYEGFDDVDFDAVAKNTEVPEFAVVAAAKAGNEELLEQIASKGNSPAIRVSAVERIGNMKRIERLASDGKYEDVQIAAVERLGNQQLLAEIALKDESRKVRRKAVERLLDQDVLTVSAREDSEPEVRIAAIKRLTDETVLTGLANVAENSEEIAAAANRRLKVTRRIRKKLEERLGDDAPEGVPESLVYLSGLFLGRMACVYVLKCFDYDYQDKSGAEQVGVALLVKDFTHSIGDIVGSAHRPASVNGREFADRQFRRVDFTTPYEIVEIGTTDKKNLQTGTITPDVPYIKVRNVLTNEESVVYRRSSEAIDRLRYGGH